MKKWKNILVCDPCWTRTNPDREPIRMIDAGEELCELCGRITNSGIYVRKEVAV